ncbi:hypothetical protein Tco_1356553 [Tanacetum coccineum]
MKNNHHPYGILKRKDRDPPITNTNKKMRMMMTSSSSKLLAGYMAYEFLTKGSVLGHNKLDNKTEEKVNESYSEITSLIMNNNGDNSSSNSNNDGVCIPGVVNPTQVAKWIKM